MAVQFCDCGVWAKRANDPFFPIWYNAKANEYVFSWANQRMLLLEERSEPSGRQAIEVEH